MKVKCINDKNKPQDFPKSLWIKEGEIYTIVLAQRMNLMGGIIGVQLEEIDTTNNFPYTHFDARRFVPIDTDGELTDDELEEQLKDVFKEDLVEI